MRREVLRISIPFREPFRTATTTITERELLLLVLEENGVRGYGEGAPFEAYDGVTLAEVAAALVGGPGAGAPPQALAAEEMARLDLEARLGGGPLGGVGAELLPVNATIPALPAADAAQRAREAVRQGYSCVKLKAGLPDDAERVGAVRSAIGPWPALRLDANGAWDVPEAIERIGVLDEHELELVEQPCASLEELAEVRAAVSVPIAADEPIAGPADVERAAALAACDIVCVKLAACGGFGAARRTLEVAAAHGLGTIVSSTLDGPWGIAASLQLAAAEDVRLPCGLATLELFDGPLARALPSPRGGVLAVPQGPGLGVEIDPAALEAAVVERLA